MYVDRGSKVTYYNGASLCEIWILVINEVMIVGVRFEMCRYNHNNLKCFLSGYCSF